MTTPSDAFQAVRDRIQIEVIVDMSAAAFMRDRILPDQLDNTTTTELQTDAWDYLLGCLCI